MQCYSLRGLEAVAGLNISSTIGNVFNVVYLAFGNAVSIIVGQLLGAGKMKEARETDTKLIAFSVAACVCIGAILALLAPLFPEIYNTSGEVKALAASFIRIIAICMPMGAFIHASYFTLRSGGKTVVTFLFDSVFMWLVNIPFAYVLKMCIRDRWREDRGTPDKFPANTLEKIYRPLYNRSIFLYSQEKGA